MIQKNSRIPNDLKAEITITKKQTRRRIRERIAMSVQIDRIAEWRTRREIGQ